tara:strand:+ start:1478 stop:1861 length:384 start_codon:yes stop_codon:yes gene_type:complete
MNTNVVELIKLLITDENKADKTETAEAKPQWTFAKSHRGNTVLVRAKNAGIHVGTLKEATSDFITLENSNRIWKWEGAFTLSEVSQNGITGGKVACEVPLVSIPTVDVGELIPMSISAHVSILEHIE